MSMSYERIQICGNIGSSEFLTSSQGTKYFQLSVAVDRTVKDVKTTIWYKVLMFGAMGQDDSLLARYSKGRKVIVEGRPQFSAYKKLDGSPALDSTIIAMVPPHLV